MSGKPTRDVFGLALMCSRALGVLLIALAILGLPQMRFLTGRLTASLETIMSVTLMLAGVLVLFGGQMFLHFFDHYLSRN